MKTQITIFLDLDGVLITTPPWQQDVIGADGYSVFKPKLVNNLNTLLSKWDFEIVLSSSRRKTHSLEQFNIFFQNRGIVHEIAAYTPISLEKKSRKEEIEAYIYKNSIQNFLILDDDTSLNNLDKKFKDRLVLTKHMLGFNHEKLEEAIEKISHQMMEFV